MAATNPGTATLVAAISCDEASGSRADGSGNGNTLTAVNAPGSRTGAVDDELDLVAASSQYLYRADADCVDIDFSSGSMSGVAFITRDLAGSNAGFIGKWTSGVHGWLVYMNGSTSIRLIVIGDTGSQKFVTLTTPALGTRFFIRFWYDDVSEVIGARLDEDAGTEQTTSHTDGIGDGTGNFQLGGYNGGANFPDGGIDAVFLFSHVLTDDEGEWMRNSGNGRTVAELGGGGGGGATIPIFAHHQRMMRGTG